MSMRADKKTQKNAGKVSACGKARSARVKTIFVDNFFFFLGCAMYAAAVNIFAIPNNISQSGVTGISIILSHLFSFPVGVTNLVLNIPLLILARIFLGRGFVAKTLWVTVILSVALDVFSLFLPEYTGDRLLSALFCGAISGIGLAMILARGATSGGADIVSRLFRLKWPHISMGTVLLVFDGLIVVASALTFRNVESALYAAIVIFISSQVIDYVLYGTGHGKLLMVVTTKGEEITEAITSRLRRGVTRLPVTGGYTGEHKEMLMCAVRPSELSKLNSIIREIDDETFTIVSEAGEVLGEGFRLPDAEKGRIHQKNRNTRKDKNKILEK